MRVKKVDCQILLVWRNRRTPGEGSASVNSGYSRIRPHGTGGTLNWVPSVYSLGSASIYTQFLVCFLLIPHIIKHQINLFSEKHPSKLPITTKESFFSPQQVENHFPPEFKFKNNPMNLSTKGRNPLVGSLTSVVS